MSGHIIDFLLVTAYFKVSEGTRETGENYGIEFSTIHRNILIKLKDCNEFYRFAYFIKKSLERMNKEKRQHDASSFFRKYNKVDFIVDAK